MLHQTNIGIHHREPNQIVNHQGIIMLYKLLTLSVVISITQGCSNKQIYDAAQGNHRLKCQQLPQAQYEDCMKQIEEDFDDYNQKRKEDQSQN